MNKINFIAFCFFNPEEFFESIKFVLKLKYLRHNILILIFSLVSVYSFSQSNNDLIQFSGYTLMGVNDSIQPAPFILIKNKSRNSGSYSNPDGFFSLVVMTGDTIEFTSVGFKKSTLIVPTSISSKKFTANQIMIREIQRLPETVIVPWKTLNELKRALLDLKITDDDLIIAYQNMQYQKWATLRESMPLSGTESQRYAQSNQNMNNLLYQSGITPANNILNPIAWYQFINTLTNNKKKKKEKDLQYKYEE